MTNQRTLIGLVIINMTNQRTLIGHVIIINQSENLFANEVIIQYDFYWSDYYYFNKKLVI